MNIDYLKINNIRSLEGVEIRPSEGFNLFVGNNGAGKTSIIEAIYALARGRTFRGAGAGPLIKRGESSFDVFARLYQAGSSSRSIGIQRGNKEVEIRVDGRSLSRLSDLARAFPVQILATQSHQMFERGAQSRRRLIDWGLFHVEHRYHALYARYRRILRQRNQLLKTPIANTNPWDEQLSEVGIIVDRERKAYLDQLLPLIRAELMSFPEMPEVAISYSPGWQTSLPLDESLVRALSTDRKRGYTSVGPHAADLVFKVGRFPVSKVVSRGQQKILAFCVLLAQAVLLESKTTIGPVVLFDDFAAELDKSNVSRIIQLLEDSRFQVFLTAVDDVLSGGKSDTATQCQMFHVEHGLVTQL